MTRTDKAQRNRGAAVRAFLCKKAEIDVLLDRLTAISADHFNAIPDEINWGNVGDLGRYVILLRQITDNVFREGEHAETQP